ncbi:MAG TPA: PEGA domain-containing protein, partial [Phycisphaerales bacterium]|nr:PEGA domain-containing protein [Phycisphaerales bacterium]
LAKEEDDRSRSARAVADMLQECVRDLEAQNVEDLQPAWDETIEELPDDERSVLLAISFLGQEATFEKVCLAAPFSEDKTDRCLEALMERKLIDSPTEDRFSLRVPEDTVQTRLTPRLRKLFATRLSSMEASLSNGGSGSVQVLEPAPGSESPEVAAPRADSSAPSPVGGTTEDVVPPPEETHQEPEPANTAPVEVAQSPDTKPKSQESPSAKPRWALISAIMLVIGVVLTVAGQWYYSHSASVHITTNPAGAVVEVNGLERGKSPLTVSELT